LFSFLRRSRRRGGICRPFQRQAGSLGPAQRHTARKAARATAAGRRARRGVPRH
jgi:hypothetical protein